MDENDIQERRRATLRATPCVVSVETPTKSGAFVVRGAGGSVELCRHRTRSSAEKCAALPCWTRVSNAVKAGWVK